MERPVSLPLASVTAGQAGEVGGDQFEAGSHIVVPQVSTVTPPARRAPGARTVPGTVTVPMVESAITVSHISLPSSSRPQIKRKFFH